MMTTVVAEMCSNVLVGVEDIRVVSMGGVGRHEPALTIAAVFCLFGSLVTEMNSLFFSSCDR